ncbi:MAG: HEAT repeat domain-containing protein [Verrucomicrobiae bacterium]|nr:HEAT repeat domain-containing protein [Verrucomicrobiae bacterium]
MNGHLRIFQLILVIAYSSLTVCNAIADEEDIKASLKQLRDPDVEVRIEALRSVMTSLDPQLPEAILPLLDDEGNSTRRLAARAIGSRWWQIAEKRIPSFVEALEKHKGSRFEDERNMVLRALGLLKKDYTSAMFARSADRRWVIYERRGLPCLIDTKTQTEELIGWTPDQDGQMPAAWGNARLTDSVVWHPKRNWVVLDILLGRKAGSVWVWREEGGLLQCSPATFAKALNQPEETIFYGAGFFPSIQGWKGENVLINVSYSTETQGNFVDHEASFAWHVGTNSLKVTSRTSSP